MSEVPEVLQGGPLAGLRRMVKERVPDEVCDLCGEGIPAEHRHLMEPKTRQLVCSCQACSILFSGDADTRYRLVPDRLRFLSGFACTDEQWESLMIPVGIAFFYNSVPAERVVAMYPSPAGATESLLTFESWSDLELANPVLKGMEPDVEALLVNRVRDNRDYFIAPIDECYKLVGLIRAGWRGISGGGEVWETIDEFFIDLRTRARVVGESVA